MFRRRASQHGRQPGIAMTKCLIGAGQGLCCVLRNTRLFLILRPARVPHRISKRDPGRQSLHGNRQPVTQRRERSRTVCHVPPWMDGTRGLVSRCRNNGGTLMTSRLPLSPFHSPFGLASLTPVGAQPKAPGHWGRWPVASGHSTLKPAACGNIPGLAQRRDISHKEINPHSTLDRFGASHPYLALPSLVFSPSRRHASKPALSPLSWTCRYSASHHICVACSCYRTPACQHVVRPLATKPHLTWLVLRLVTSSAVLSSALLALPRKPLPLAAPTRSQPAPTSHSGWLFRQRGSGALGESTGRASRGGDGPG